MEHGNLFARIPDELPDELIEVLALSDLIRIERIVSRGHTSPDAFWYDQDQGEWVLVVKGRGSLLFEGEDEPRMMHPGDYIHIPPHTKHRVEWTDPEEDTIWLAIHY